MWNIIENARIKLTLWYLAIIMVVSISFSLGFYRIVAGEFEFQANTLRHRPGLEMEFINDNLLMSRRRFFYRLVYLNGFIFLGAGAAGYFLAGKALSPLHESIERERQFISDASHELRNPLASLKTSMEVEMRNRKLGKKVKEMFLENLSDVNRLIRLTNSLLGLTFVKPEKFTQVEMDMVIDQAVRPVKDEIEAKKISFEYKRTGLKVLGDKDSLIQVFSNLIENAVKYNQDGGKVSVFAQKYLRGVIIKVSDTGMGIEKKHLLYIFDRFYRADSSRSGASGYGLGLSLVKKIVEEHGGSVNVVSKEGKGTTFSVYLQK